MKTITITERLAQLREDQDLPQRGVARTLGVNPATVYRWENGLRSPRIAAVAAYADLLGQRIVVRRGDHVVNVLDVLPNLGVLRRRAGLTQTQLAARMYVSRHTIGMAETHTTAESWLHSLEKYVKPLGCTLDLAPAEEESC
ncbi:helix-turn-helix domain-containing protein [Streptosporangium sp. G12]